MLNKEIVIIIPPITDSTMPSMSAAVIQSYFRNIGYKTQIYDINIQLFNELLDQKNINYIKNKAKKCLANKKDKSFKNYCLDRSIAKSLDFINNSVIDKYSDITGLFKNVSLYRSFDSYHNLVTYTDEYLNLISNISWPFYINTETVGCRNIKLSNMNSLHEIFLSIENNQPVFYSIFKDIVKRVPPADIYAITSSYYSQSLFTMILPKLIKERNGSAKVIVGGANTEHYFNCIKPKSVSSPLLGYIDGIYVGEIESKGLEHLNKLTKNKELVITDARMLPAAPDKICSPDYATFPLDDYLSPQRILSYGPTRGCYWNKCTFCRNSFARGSNRTISYREQSLKTVETDIKRMIENYKTSNFCFAVDSINPDYLSKLSALFINKNMQIKYYAELRIENKFSIIAPKLAKSGLQYVTLGFESCNDRILNKMQKGSTVALQEKVLNALTNNGIMVDPLMFIGFPGETKQEREDTYAFFVRNKKKIFNIDQVGLFHLLRDSYIYYHPDKYNLSICKGSDQSVTHNVPFIDKNVSLLRESSNKIINDSYAWIENNFYPTHRPWAGSAYSAHTFIMAMLYNGNLWEEYNKWLSKNKHDDDVDGNNTIYDEAYRSIRPNYYSDNVFSKIDSIIKNVGGV